MSTTILPLENNAWTLIRTGPTTEPIFIEKKYGGAAVWVCVADSEPPFTCNGHFLLDGKIKAVELGEGEKLYAYTTVWQTNLTASLTITD